MRLRVPANVVIGAVAIATVLTTSAVIAWRISNAIGRGTGRAAVHEFAHQALGADNLRHIDNRTDEQSYEYGSADRAAQYYGELRWTTAWPVLEDKFGK